MFLITRPSPAEIERFLQQSRELPLSYDAIGVARSGAPGYAFDEEIAVIGNGSGDFERARLALCAWKQFEVGWVELFPRGASCEPATTAAVLIRHFGHWSLNGCRVVYRVEDCDPRVHFGYAYGTLTNHAEAGEELFEVFLDEAGDVVYRLRAVSRPLAWLARVGAPVVRFLQARFRKDSVDAMRRAMGQYSRNIR